MPNTSSGVLPDRLTAAEATDVLERLCELLDAEPGELRVDAGALRTFDSSAVAVLLEVRRRAARKGRVLVVDNLPGRLRDLMGLYGVNGLLGA